MFVYWGAFDFSCPFQLFWNTRDTGIIVRFERRESQPNLHSMIDYPPGYYFHLLTQGHPTLSDGVSA